MKRWMVPITLALAFTFGIVANGAAEDLQGAYGKMQQALDEYQAAVLQSMQDTRKVAEKRDAYLAAKKTFENLKAGGAVVTGTPSAPAAPTTRTAQAASQVAVSPKPPDPALFPKTRPLSTTEGMNLVIGKIANGAKVTEKDLDITWQETNDNKLELQAGETFWQSVTKDIQGAKKSIHIQMFGMEADKTGWEFARMLAAKARSGIDVVLVADLNGARMMGPKNLISTTEEEKLFKFYRDNGVKVVFYNRLSQATSLGKKLDFFHFDHRKIWVIDGEVGYAGGYTLQQPSREIKHDLMVRATGSVVQQMQAGVMLSYLYSGGKIPPADAQTVKARDFPPPASGGTMNGRLTYNIPRGNHELHASYIREIDAAKKYLYIINPYITNNDMIDRIAAAARRGVDVRIVVPGSAENPLNDTNMRGHFEKLQKAGVRIMLYQGENKLGKLHAKGMIRDDEFASIGSCNMDTMSLRGNFEANVDSKDPGFVRSIRTDLFEKDFRVSTEYVAPKSRWERFKIKVKGGITELLDRFD